MGESLWPAAGPLASWLAGLAGSDGCRSLLELGCGAGLCALAFAKATGAPIVLTDYDDRVLELAKMNAELNGVSAYHVRSLELGCLPETLALVDEFGTFPLVVASDIIYEQGQVARVLSSVVRLLDADARCIVALSDAFQNYIAPLMAQAEAKDFSAEVIVHSGISLVILTRGNPAWSLPPCKDFDPADSSGGTDETMHRAELLFA